MRVVRTGISNATGDAVYRPKGGGGFLLTLVFVFGRGKFQTQSIQGSSVHFLTARKLSPRQCPGVFRFNATLFGARVVGITVVVVVATSIVIVIRHFPTTRDVAKYGPRGGRGGCCVHICVFTTTIVIVIIITTTTTTTIIIGTVNVCS